MFDSSAGHHGRASDEVILAPFNDPQLLLRAAAALPYSDFLLSRADGEMLRKQDPAPGSVGLQLKRHV
ncbi:MAG: hypothetical protein CL844_04935 [Crocinitomicaceae bacterium]|nr:hypothetical protein [Crocinitomicaceae bacterium]